jgi:hypothetical protein
MRLLAVLITHAAFTGGDVPRDCRHSVGPRMLPHNSTTAPDNRTTVRNSHSPLQTDLPDLPPRPISLWCRQHAQAETTLSCGMGPLATTYVRRSKLDPSIS